MGRVIVRSRGAVLGLSFSSDGDRYFAATPSGIAATVARVRLRLDAMPDTAFRIIAGSSNGATGTGWLVNTEDTVGGAAVGQLVVYAGIGGTLTRVARKFLMPADIGRVFTLHILAYGSRVFAFLDGRKSGVGVAGAGISGATGPFNFGARSNGTNSNRAVTLLDVAEGTTPLTPGQVLDDASASVPSFVGMTSRFLATSSVGSAWSPDVGTIVLSRGGTPALSSFSAVYGHHVGSLEIWGDSIALGRQAGNTAGDGWVRAFQRSLSSDYGKAITLCGFNAPNAGTIDYDQWRSATGGESLSTRLATLAADLTLYAPSDAATVIAYGINDIVALGRTDAQLRSDVTTACGIIAAARPGRPIFVLNTMQVSDVAATAPQRAYVTAYQASFAAFVASLRSAYPQVRGVDTSPAVTNRNDTNVLYDGTHPTPATYATMAGLITPVVADSFS